jgi:glycerophosphoryl diester phosphodiesterase
MIFSLYQFCLYMMMCAIVANAAAQKTPVPKLDLQGHRGCRGLMPENTIPAMLRAIDLGVTTLEMDVVISKDGKVVLSHDPYFNDLFTTAPDGKLLTPAAAKEILLYNLAYDSIRKYDVGLKPHPVYPNQQKMAVHKPLLSEVIESCERHAARHGKTIRYNIEIKSVAGFDKLRHPDVPTFCKLVLDIIRASNILDRTTVQSFDVRPLQYLHKEQPDVVLSYLVEGAAKPVQQYIDTLGFVPRYLSPNYKLLSPELVRAAHGQGMLVLPWTINTLPEMKAAIRMGADGIISDYPDLFAQLH